ncbi:hypothetical protein [Nocardia sp. NPDC050175]|uniref:hypothetical protein n=1 Tax=Nocardia sp. NPDC050175 TaxID=3364317 RepID=UPI003788FB7E
MDSVIRTQHLKEVGVSADAIVRRCSKGGPWQRILPGVVLLHNGVPTTSQRHRAALVYAGREALLTSHAGLACHGLAAATVRDVQVLIPHRRKRSSTGFVVVERTTRMPEMITKSGLGLAPPTRCAMDAARRMPGRQECRSLLTSVIQRRLTTPAALATELREGTTRGTAVVRAVVEELMSGAHSVAEVDAQRLYRQSGLPLMQHNIDVLDESGVFIARPDGWIDDIALAWEIDSLTHHLAIADHERTLKRRARMERLGIVVVSHLPNQLKLDPETVIADLRAGFYRASTRPRPPVLTYQRSD